jgi:hypothetical protein
VLSIEVARQKSTGKFVAAAGASKKNPLRGDIFPARSEARLKTAYHPQTGCHAGELKK